MLPQGRFMINQAGRTARSNEAGGCAGGRIPIGRATQAGEVSAEDLDEDKSHTERVEEGLLGVRQNSLSQHAPKIKP
jgi:hypothetical protein